MMIDKETFAVFCANVEMVAVDHYDPQTGLLHVWEGNWLLQRDYWNDLNSMVPVVEKLIARSGLIIEFKSGNLPISIRRDFRNFIIDAMEEDE